MSRHNIDPQERGFYFAESGLNKFDGATFERPKKSIQDAIDAASALIPPPSASATAQVSAAQGGTFTEGFTLAEGIQFEAVNVTLITDLPVSVTLASFLLCRLSGLQNEQDDGVCFLVDGKFSVGLRTLFTGVLGEDGIGFKITGSNRSIFMSSDQMIISGVGAVGCDITGTSTDPIDINIDSVLLTGDDTAFCNYNPDNSSDSCVINISTIQTQGAINTTGYVAENGLLVAIQQGVLIVGVAAHVKSGAIMILDCSNVIGDIIIDSGGILSANIVRFSGTITNNGFLDGQIGDTFYEQKNFRGLDKPDTDKLVTYRNTGTNGGGTDHYFTTRDPSGNIQALPGSVAFREDDIDTDIYINKGSALNSDKWKRLVTAGGIGDISFEGNGAATVISFIDTYVPINTVSAWLLSSLSVDFVLHTDGKSLKCISEIPIKVLIVEGVTLSSGPIETYEVGVFLNTVLVTRSTFTLDVRQADPNVSHTYFAQVTNGDLLEMRIQNITSTSNPVIIEAYLTVAKVS